MYLPATELQQYRGQLTCPYCIQDLRAEDRAITDAAEHPQGKPRLEAVQEPERCERCGRDLQNRVYIWNGRKLCRKCLDDEQDTWGLVTGKPMGPAQRIRVGTAERKERFLERMAGDFLALIGLRRKQVKEVVVYGPRMQGEIIAAKPMAEKTAAMRPAIVKAPAEREKRAPRIEVEDIMTGRKKAALIVPVQKPAAPGAAASIVVQPQPGPQAQGKGADAGGRPAAKKRREKKQ
jgi:ribosomal protein S14